MFVIFCYNKNRYMMKIKHKKSFNQKPLFIAIVVLVLVLIIFIAYRIDINKNNTQQQGPTKEQIEKEKDTSSDGKQEFIEKSPTETDNSTWVTHESDDITLNTSKDSSNLIINVQLKNYSNGTCEIIIKNGDDQYTKSADIIYQPSFSTCSGFSVPLNSLPSGVWQITLSATSKGIITTKSILVDI